MSFLAPGPTGLTTSHGVAAWLPTATNELQAVTGPWAVANDGNAPFGASLNNPGGANGNTFTLPFQGNVIGVIVRKQSDGGYVDVSVNGVALSAVDGNLANHTFDMYSASAQVIPYMLQNPVPPAVINNGIYTVTFTLNGQNASSSGYTCPIMGFITDGASSGQTMTKAFLVGAPAITLSGTSAVNLTQVNGTALSEGQKTMANSLPVTVASDQAAFPVTAANPPLAAWLPVNVNELSALTGFTVVADTNAPLSAALSASTNGNSFTVAFMGTTFGLRYKMQSSSGTVDISFDGGGATAAVDGNGQGHTLDLYSATTKWDEYIIRNNLAAGHHTATITINGKNGSSSGYTCYIGAMYFDGTQHGVAQSRVALVGTPAVSISGTPAVSVQGTATVAITGGGSPPGLGPQTGANSLSITKASDEEPTNKATYSAAVVGFTPAASATDIVALTYGGSKVVRLRRVAVWGTASASTQAAVLLMKRSTANSAGTAVTAVAHDSGSAAANATISSYTSNPTTGTLVGPIRAGLTYFPASGTPALAEPMVWTFSDVPSQAVVLRSAGETVAVNLNGVTISGGSVYVEVTWTEE